MNTSTPRNDRRSSSAAYVVGERLPDLTEVPPIGSKQRDTDERNVMARSRELIIQEDGRLREALFELEQELRGLGEERPTRAAYEVAREYACALVNHVEQCWASAVLR